MVSIIEVTDKAQLRRFVDYPNELYKDVPQFVPATYGDDLSDWDRSKNPAFEYCDARCWLAMRDGEIVGRIGAIHSRKANDKWGANRLRFTQVDFIDDPEVSSALFRTVEAWAKELDCTAVHGPLGFTDMDREGMLVEGFDRRSCFFTYYNYPYYIDHMAALGYVNPGLCEGRGLDRGAYHRPGGRGHHTALGEDLRLRSQAPPSAHSRGQEPPVLSAPAQAVFRAGQPGLRAAVRHCGSL